MYFISDYPFPGLNPNFVIAYYSSDTMLDCHFWYWLWFSHSYQTEEVFSYHSLSFIVFNTVCFKWFISFKTLWIALRFLFLNYLLWSFILVFLFSFRMLKQNTTDWVVGKQQKFIAYSSGAWKSNIKFPKCLPPGEDPFLVHSWCLPARSSHGGRGQGSFGSLFYRNTYPIYRTPSSWPNHLPKTPLPNTIIFGG